MEKETELKLQTGFNEGVVKRESKRQSLRVQLQEALHYNRNYQNLGLGIAFTAGTLFFTLLNYYAGLKLNPEMRKINQIREMQNLVPVFGIATSWIFVVGQYYSMKLYRFTLQAYVYPILKQLEIVPKLNAEQERIRKQIEFAMGYLLVIISVLEFLAWVAILLVELKILNLRLV